MCLRYANQSRLNNQHNWGGLYDQLMNMRIFTLIRNKIFIQVPKIMRKVAMALLWIC